MTAKSLPGEEKPTYEYDPNNRLAKVGATGYEYDAANDPTKVGASTYTYTSANELETGTSVKYTYDTFGERTKTTQLLVLQLPMATTRPVAWFQLNDQRKVRRLKSKIHTATVQMNCEHRRH